MEDIDPLKALRAEIDAERIATLKRLEMYRALTRKMMAYQTSQGPAPTHEEFEQWRLTVGKAGLSRKADIGSL